MKLHEAALQRPDFIPVSIMLDMVGGELHIFNHRGQLVGLLRGVELLQPGEPAFPLRNGEWKPK